MKKTPAIGPEQREHKHNISTRTVAIGVAVLVIATSVLVKHCLGENDGKDAKPKIEEQVPAEEATAKPILLPQDTPNFVITTTAPDAGRAGTFDAGQSPPDASELTVEQACQELKNITAEDDATGIYSLLKNIMDLLENNITMESGDETFGKIAGACNFSEKQLLNILKIAIEQGDTRVADLVNDLIRKKCRDKTGELTTQHFQEYMRDMRSCGQLPMEDIAGRKACVGQGVAGRERRKQEAKDFAENQCPSETAADMGLDQDKIEELAALKYANELATGKLVLINPEVAPSKDDIMAYMMALRPIVAHLNGPAILEALGVKSEAEFKKKYIDDVAVALKKHEGELYQNFAKALEAIYKIGKALENF